MTALLAQAFAEAAKRPEAEQDVLAARLLAELSADDDFDLAIAATSAQLAHLATEALSSNQLASIATDPSPRVGGQWRGRVRIAQDFDAMPNDIAAAFGVEPQ